MSQIHQDSFDHWTTIQHGIEKWGLGLSTGLTVGAYGTAGSNGLKIDAGGVSQVTGYLQFGVANLATVIASFAFYGTGDDRQICRFMDNATEQVSIILRSDGRLAATGPWGTTVGTAVISATVPKWISIKALFHASAGRVQVTVDGTSDIDTGGGGVDTIATANAYATAFRLGYGPSSAETKSYVHYYDDFLLCNSSGSTMNDLLTQRRVQCRFPTGAGSQTDFDPSTGNNWENVDDAAPDDDSTYNGSSTVGEDDLFTMQNLSASTATVDAIAVVTRARKEDAGPRTLRNILYLSTASVTRQESADLSPSTAYNYHNAIFHTDGDGNAWNVTKANAVEAGYELQA